MRAFDLAGAEESRLSSQASLDAERTARERNALGQFATPPMLARDIVRAALRHHAGTEVRFFEPSCGSGSFFSALLVEAGDYGVEIADATGIELDPRFVAVARHLWRRAGLHVVEGDFFERSAVQPRSVSLLLANPPYVRHHHLASDLKRNLADRCQSQVGPKPSGLAGLYVYFMLLAHETLAPGAISAWLVPSEFLDTNYGAAVREYLRTHVRLLQIHRFDPEGTQFDDALVTSCVVLFENAPSPEGHLVRFTEGGTTGEPHSTRMLPQDSLRPRTKWSMHFRASRSPSHETRPQLGQFLRVKRGIATGRNAFFILRKEQLGDLGIRRENVTPIVPSPRNLKTDTLTQASEGYPDLPDQLAVLTPRGTWDEICADDPALARYLNSADEKTRRSYLVSKRTPWFKMEHRDPAPFLLTYLGRGKSGEERPFRFIANYSEAVATNLYLMLYPIGALNLALRSGDVALGTVFEALKSISSEDLLQGGRVYGGGLRKIEPRELAQMDASALAELLPESASVDPQQSLF